MGRRKPIPAAPSGGITWLHWQAPKSAPRNPEPWNEEIPETDRGLQEGDFDQLHSAITDEINNVIVDGNAESPAGAALIARLRAMLEQVKDLVGQAEGSFGQVEALRDHADELQTAARDVAARVGEADEIRDAIEGHMGTAPHVWADALHVIRTGGNVRDMWCVGKR